MTIEVKMSSDFFIIGYFFCAFYSNWREGRANYLEVQRTIRGFHPLFPSVFIKNDNLCRWSLAS